MWPLTCVESALHGILRLVFCPPPSENGLSLKALEQSLRRLGRRSPHFEILLKNYPFRPLSCTLTIDDL